MSNECEREWCGQGVLSKVRKREWWGRGVMSKVCERE